MATAEKVKVLCVDDEPHVLDGVSLHLRRGFEVVTAANGEQALARLAQHGPFAVVLSDMRMPGMNGAELLSACRERAPDTVRMLLTGYADVESAIKAVNEGQLFRFLTKPCPPAMLLTAFHAAAEQHRLVTTERVLLEQTLRGIVRTLTDMLALTNPVAFGRAARIRELAVRLARQLAMAETWSIEVAAMLAHLGTITLPPETVERLYYGRPMSPAEQAQVARLPEVTEQLLGHIPRLEHVRAILSGLLLGTHTTGGHAIVANGSARRSSTGAPSVIPALPANGHTAPAGLGAAHSAAPFASRVLRTAFDFDALESSGLTVSAALDVLRGRRGLYDPQILDGLHAIMGHTQSQRIVKEMPLAQVSVGMVFVDDVRMSSGAVLVPRGFEVTVGFLTRAREFARSVPGLVRVEVTNLS